MTTILDELNDLNTRVAAHKADLRTQIKTLREELAKLEKAHPTRRPRKAKPTEGRPKEKP
jgi:hypothetical protein